MDEKIFEELVLEGLNSLPRKFKQALKNVQIVVEDEPTPEQAGSVNAGRQSSVLGLYEGVPLLKRTTQYGNVMPDKISIFKKNIEQICKTPEDIKRVVIHTVQHELAHHFGITDKRLKDLDIY